jgi:NAD(P)-dependent dehydrogenase (short-subunit alcohol dehydrogenase family)
MSASGKVMVVTGAASGMGRLAAQRYAQQGNTIIGLDLNAQGLKETAEVSDNIHTHTVDITRYEDVESVINSVEKEHGPVERLVNCAGIMPLGTLHSQDVHLIQKIMDVNYSGTINTNKAVLSYMRERGRGEIVNFASIAGWAPTISFGAYNAAKFAVVAFTEVLYHENKNDGINVCCVCPPPVNTPLLRNAINRPKVLNMAPVAEPEYIIDHMEKTLAKGKLFCFPSFINYLSYIGRRWAPAFVWWAVHLLEGKDLARLSKQPEAAAKPQEKNVA